MCRRERTNATEKKTQFAGKHPKWIVLSGIFADNKVNFSNIFHAFGDDNSNLVDLDERKNLAAHIQTFAKLLNTSVNTSRYRCTTIPPFDVFGRQGKRHIYHICSIYMELKRLQWPLIWIKNHCNWISEKSTTKWKTYWIVAACVIVQSLVNAFNPAKWKPESCSVKCEISAHM